MDETVPHTKSAGRKNMVQLVFLIIALIPLNYAIYASFKYALKAGSPKAPSADGAANAANQQAEFPGFDTYLNAGLAFYNQKQYDKAVEQWRLALKINPNSDMAYNDLGAAYGCLGKWQDQKEACERALAINPNFQLAKNNLKWALDELAKAGTPAPPPPPPGPNDAKVNALLQQGFTKYNQKDYAGAVEVWRSALAFNPNSELIYTNMGAAYGCMGKWKEQVDCCRKALSINPDFQLAANNLAWGESELKKRGITY